MILAKSPVGNINIVDRIELILELWLSGQTHIGLEKCFFVKKWSENSKDDVGYLKTARNSQLDPGHASEPTIHEFQGMLNSNLKLPKAIKTA